MARKLVIAIDYGTKVTSVAYAFESSLATKEAVAGHGLDGSGSDWKKDGEAEPGLPVSKPKTHTADLKDDSDQNGISDPDLESLYGGEGFLLKEITSIFQMMEEAYNDILKPMEERMIALIRANVDDSQPSKILSKL